MQFRRLFHDAINTIMFTHRPDDLDGYIVSWFDPHDWMMFNLNGGNALFKVCGMAKDMDLVAQFQTFI